MDSLINLMIKKIGDILKIYRTKIITRERTNTQNIKINTRNINRNIRKSHLKTYIWQKLVEISLQAKIKQMVYKAINFHIVFNQP